MVLGVQMDEDGTLWFNGKKLGETKERAIRESVLRETPESVYFPW